MNRMPETFECDISAAEDDAVAELPLDIARLDRAKTSYAARHVPLRRAVRLLTGAIVPQAGDLVLARVEKIGQHGRIELGTGRRATLHVGDEVVLCFGSRYAPDQFEAFVPGDLGPCDMVAAGGIAARCVGQHGRMKQPTRIQPLGILADASGDRLNLASFALPDAPTPMRRPAVYVVCGSTMNAGKTTMAAHTLRGLKSRGLSVGAAKVTGTGAGCDRWVMADAGADKVLDFTDCGVPSTFGLDEAAVCAIFDQLVDHLAAAGMDAVVVEIADGIYQRETRFLLESPHVRARCEGVLFAALDALSAVAGVAILQAVGHRILAVGGAMTESPLAIRETASAIDVPVTTSQALATGRADFFDRKVMEHPLADASLATSPYVKWVSSEPIAAASA